MKSKEEILIWIEEHFDRMCLHPGMYAGNMDIHGMDTFETIIWQLLLFKEIILEQNFTDKFGQVMRKCFKTGPCGLSSVCKTEKEFIECIRFLWQETSSVA